MPGKGELSPASNFRYQTVPRSTVALPSRSRPCASVPKRHAALPRDTIPRPDAAALCQSYALPCLSNTTIYHYCSARHRARATLHHTMPDHHKTSQDLTVTLLCCTTLGQNLT